jgi:hypothetical protein
MAQLICRRASLAHFPWAQPIRAAGRSARTAGTDRFEDEINELRRVIEGRNIVLVSDEVYEHITFDWRRHLGLLRYPDLAERIP